MDKGLGELACFPAVRAKRHPIKARLAGDDLAEISVPALIRATCSDTIEAALSKLVQVFGVEVAEEIYQDVADRVAERFRNADKPR